MILQSIGCEVLGVLNLGTTRGRKKQTERKVEVKYIQWACKHVNSTNMFELLTECHKISQNKINYTSLEYTHITVRAAIFLALPLTVITRDLLNQCVINIISLLNT